MLPVIIILSLTILSIFFFVKGTPTVIKHRVTLKELQKMQCEQPPILVTTIKNGRMEETLCYLSPKESNKEPQIMEIIPDKDFMINYKWRRKKLPY